MLNAGLWFEALGSWAVFVCCRSRLTVTSYSKSLSFHLNLHHKQEVLSDLALGGRTLAALQMAHVISLVASTPLSVWLTCRWCFHDVRKVKGAQLILLLVLWWAKQRGRLQFTPLETASFFFLWKTPFFWKLTFFLFNVVGCTTVRYFTRVSGWRWYLTIIIVKLSSC